MPTRRAAPRIACLALALALAAAAAARAADLKIEQLELVTHGALDQATGKFQVGSRLFFDLALEGGDKFGGLLRLSFLNGDIEKALALAETKVADADGAIARLNSLTSPRFKTAAVTARSFLGLPLDLSYFIGYMDAFASGDDFVPLFGAAPFSTELRGPMVYPEGIGGNPDLYYQGIHAVNGTGFRLSTTARLSPEAMGMLYMYQDSDQGAGSWSVDLRGLLNKEQVKVEGFAGLTLAEGVGLYRGGILFYAFSGDVGEFFAQVGIPRWNPSETFSVDNMYFLFEPRVNFGSGSIAITVFRHPSWYRQRLTNAMGRFDVAVNLRFGRISMTGNQGGIEVMVALNPGSSPPATADLSPYYSLIAGGIQWDFKLDLRVFPFPNPWYGMLRPFIGLKTSF